MKTILHRYASAPSENRSDLDRRLFVIKKVSDQLEGIVEDMTDTSDNVKQASVFMAEGAVKQTQAVEDCIKLTDDFTLMMDDMDDKSNGLIKSLDNISEVNEHGNHSIVDLSRSEAENEKAMKALTEQIYSLLSKVQQINKIVDVIYNICEQTTLLSYNAKIEAAHAGEYGKSFSVVASEIGTLSDKSKLASENINQTIESITADLNTLKTSLDSSTEAFSVQRKAVDSVIEAFGRINSFTENYFEEQKNFNSQLGNIRVQKNGLISSLKEIFSGIQESAATAEEVASLAMSQNSNTAILGKISTDLATQANAFTIDLESEEVEKLVNHKKKVSLIYDLDDPFWIPTGREALKAAKAFDVDLDIFAPKSRSAGIFEMENRLDQLVKERRDALIISPIEDVRIENKLRQLNNADTKIIFINSKLDGVRYESLIETNGIVAGKAAAKVAKKYLNNQGEVIVGLWSDEHITSIENRAKGFIEELNTNSHITVHQVQIQGEPPFAEAERSISAMFKQYPDTKLVFATNVGWGLLYAQYAQKHHTAFKIITMDFTKDIEIAIKEGFISSAIAQRAFSWGTMSLDFLEKVFQGKAIPDYIDTGTYEVNLSNIKIYENRI